jgi:NADH dehydrogenase (ubiquinone) 1 alpha subcomplex subunit 5
VIGTGCGLKRHPLKHHHRPITISSFYTPSTMRATTRLLASIAKKPSGQFLNSYTPTGLTGLLTHPFPRPTLIQLYNQTLTKLATLPTTSVYRQSVEALTKHRLAIVTAQIPEGYAEWEAEAIKLLEKHPELKESRSIKLVDGKAYPLPLEQEQEVDDRAMESEWNNDEEVEDRGEGPRTAKDRIFQASELGEGQRVQEFEKDLPTLPNEPALTVEQYVEVLQS